MKSVFMSDLDMEGTARCASAEKNMSLAVVQTVEMGGKAAVFLFWLTAI